MDLYRFGNVPPDVPAWFVRELRRLQEQRGADFVELRKLSAEPAKLREGMTVLADGVNWSPGLLGEGVYTYYGGSWKRLG